MQVLSWNLQGNPNARQALWEYLHQRREPEMVVCLQEWGPYGAPRPQRADIDQEILTSLQGAFQVGACHITRYVSLVTLVSAGLTAHTSTAGSPAWALVCEVGQANTGSAIWRSRKTLRIVNIHQPSRVHNRTEPEREGAVEALKASLLPLFSPKPERTILVGDWNAEPHSPEMCLRARLNAGRQRMPLPASPKPGAWPAWYNPSWNLLADRAEAQGQPMGTFYYANEKWVRDKWKVFDQVLLSADLAHEWGPNWMLSVLPALSRHTPLSDGAPHADSTLRPPQPYSDHVPLHLQFPVP
jgi:endonuclease/exonuclease/phosphatase family metal-dependent hydrolase